MIEFDVAYIVYAYTAETNGENYSHSGFHLPPLQTTSR